MVTILPTGWNFKEWLPGDARTGARGISQRAWEEITPNTVAGLSSTIRPINNCWKPLFYDANSVDGLNGSATTQPVP
jgi:hypothetical protein